MNICSAYWCIQNVSKCIVELPERFSSGTIFHWEMLILQYWKVPWERVRPVTTVDGNEAGWSVCKEAVQLLQDPSPASWVDDRLKKNNLFVMSQNGVFQVFLFCKLYQKFDFLYMIMGELFALRLQTKQQFCFLASSRNVTQLSTCAPSDKIRCGNAPQAALVPFSSAKAQNTQGSSLSKLSLDPGSLQPSRPRPHHHHPLHRCFPILRTYLGAGYRGGWGKGEELATYRKHGGWRRVAGN